MIKDNQQLKQTREQLIRLEEDLAALQKEIYPLNPQRFHLMAEAYIDHIMDLRKQIDDYIGVKTYQDELKGLWMRIAGPTLHLGTASISVLTGTVDTFRKSIRDIASALKGELPKKGRNLEFEKSCDLVLFGLAPGSLRVGLGLPPEQLPTLFGPAPELPVVKAIDTFIEIASWSSSFDQYEKFPAEIGDLKYKDYIIRQVIKMSPTKNSPIESIEFSGNLVHAPKPPNLSNYSRKKLQDVIEKKTQEEILEATGTIREIDLDTKKFYLRERPNNEPHLHCEVGEDMIDDARESLGSRVKIRGIVDRDGKGEIKILKVKNIEVIKDED